MKQLLLIVLFLAPAMIQAGWKELVHFSTDKEVYLSGESILVSATTIDAEQRPVVFSKVAYIELADTVSSKVQTMALLTNGTGSAKLGIPDDLPTGNYRLIAYTRYMLNSEPEIRAEKLVAIVNANTLSRSQLTGSEYSEKMELKAFGSIIRNLKPRYRHREQVELALSDVPSNLVAYTLSIAAHIPHQNADIKQNSSNQPAIGHGKFMAEYEGHIIRAEIKGTIPANSKVLLSVPGRKPELYTGRNTSEGEYEFITRSIEGTTELASTIDTREDERYTIKFISPFAPVVRKQIPALKIDSSCIPAIISRYVALQVQSAFGLTNFEPATGAVPIETLKPEWTYLLREYTRFNTIEEVILEYVSNVRFRKMGNIRTLAVNREGQAGYTQGNTLVLLDNVPVFTHELLLRYDADLIEKIEVYRGQYVFGGQLYDGIVSFSSNEKDFRGFQLDRSTLITTYEGPQNGISLRHPDRSSVSVPDMRTTLLWQSGYAAVERHIRFETSDVSGIFRVRFEGRTSDGKTVESTGYFEVE
jgi:hypothetical protein